MGKRRLAGDLMIKTVNIIVNIQTGLWKECSQWQN